MFPDFELDVGDGHGDSKLIFESKEKESWQSSSWWSRVLDERICSAVVCKLLWRFNMLIGDHVQPKFVVI